MATISYNSTNDEIVKEIKRLENNLQRRLRRIVAKGETASQSAVSAYDRYKEKNRNNSLKNLDNTELRNIYRQLTNIDAMKTSTVKGSTSAKNIYDDVIRKHRDIGNSDFFDIYEKMYQEFPAMEAFKYEIFEYADKLFLDEDELEELENRLSELEEELEELYEEDGNIDEYEKKLDEYNEIKQKKDLADMTLQEKQDLFLRKMRSAYESTDEIFGRGGQDAFRGNLIQSLQDIFDKS